MPKPYNARWRRARASFLTAHPFCSECQKLGHITPSSVVDHIKPHKGDQALFWDEANWQALCKQCHDSYKQRLERSGKVVGCSADGWPLDARHNWNRRGG